MMDQLEVLRKLEASYVSSVRAKENVIRSGPFLISLHPTMQLVWLNNAVVDDETKPIDGPAISEMSAVFESRNRIPRMEIFQELRPELVTKLQEAAFEIECVLPVMICTKEMFVPQGASAIEIVTMTPDMDPTPFLRVVDIAFEHDEPITPERIDGMRQSIRKGTQWAAMGFIEGEPVAVASLVCADGVAELAGVGTHPNFRRRGAASAVSTHLLEQFFQQSDLAWLSAGDDTSRAVYERLGFRLAGNQVNISKPGV